MKFAETGLRPNMLFYILILLDFRLDLNRDVKRSLSAEPSAV